MSSEIQTKIGEITGKTLYSWDAKCWYSTPEAAGRGLMAENERLENSLEVKDIQIRCLAGQNDAFLDAVEKLFSKWRQATRDQI